MFRCRRIGVYGVLAYTLLVAPPIAFSGASFVERQRVELLQPIKAVVPQGGQVLIHSEERTFFLDFQGRTTVLCGESLRTLPQPPGEVVALAPSRGTGRDVLLVRKVRLGEHPFREVITSADGSLLVTVGTPDPLLTAPLVFYSGDGRIIKRVGFDRFPATSYGFEAAVSPNGSLFAIATRLSLRDGQGRKQRKVCLVVFDRKGCEVWRKPVGEATPRGLSLLKDRELIVYATWEKGQVWLKFYSLRGEELGYVNWAQSTRRIVSAVSQNDRWLAIATGALVSLVDLEKLALAWRVEEEMAGYLFDSVAVSNEGIVLASLSSRGRAAPFHLRALAPSDGSVTWRTSFDTPLHVSSLRGPTVHLSPDATRFWVFGESDCRLFVKADQE